ncbi:MAG: nuclear transport factor 2 family protein [Flavobacteriales bacterium]|nr:MAG: nuclear transport factor 2 family protein [Flavobacteriales bacterium]
MVGQKQTLNVAKAFIEAINTHDVELISSLMAPWFLFIDSQGNLLSDTSEVVAAWRHYFAMFPDYRTEVGSALCAEYRVVLIGEARA